MCWLETRLYFYFRRNTSSEYQDVEAIVAQARYAALPSDNNNVQPDHYAAVDVKQSNDHYSSIADAELNQAQHYAQL